MDKLIDIFSWIDKEMKFDTWYKVESEAQKNKIIRIMEAGLIPDCEFNADYTEFRKSKLAFETFIKIT
jgi:hypothetical protein